MRRDRREADNEHDKEAAVTSETCHGAVVEVRALELDSFATEEIFECEPSANCGFIFSIVSKLVVGRGLLLSPMKVPAATTAKPIHSPYTTPHSSAMTSWPKSGGNDMMTRIAIGISHPAGRSRTFSEKGRSFWGKVSTWREKVRRWSLLTATTSSWRNVIKMVAMRIAIPKTCHAVDEVSVRIRLQVRTAYVCISGTERSSSSSPVGIPSLLEDPLCALAPASPTSQYRPPSS